MDMSVFRKTTGSRQVLVSVATLSPSLALAALCCMPCESVLASAESCLH